jgi:two-component system, NarL family, sensor histidine kinase DevS
MPERRVTSRQALEAVNEAALAITSELELDNVLQIIVDLARELVAARYAALGIPDEQGQWSQFIVSGVSEAVIKGIPHWPKGKGLLGAVVREARPIRIPDIADDPRSVGFPANHPPMSSFLGVPIRAGGRVLGNLYLTEKVNAEAFDQQDEELIQVFATHAAIAISNARLFRQSVERGRELELRNQELGALNAVARAASQHIELDEMLSESLNQVMSVLNMESGEIFLQEEETGDMVWALYRGPDPDAFGTVKRFKRGIGFIGQVAETGQPIVTSDIASISDGEIRFMRQAVIDAGFSALVFVPLQAKNRVIGVLGVASRTHGPFRERDLNLLEGIGHQVGMAVENARLYSRVGQLAVVEERSRIGMDLHDGVIQSIYAVGLTLESVRLLLNGSGETAKLLSLAIDSLNDVIRDIRNFILDLRPQRFEGDLARGLARLVREFQANSMVLVQLIVPPELVTIIPPKIARTIFMTSQEALANVARHARATHVTVELRGDESHVMLIISDNGRGFNLDEQSQMIGHGLANMRLRAASLNGSFTVQSAPNQGATIRLDIPL